MSGDERDGFGLRRRVAGERVWRFADTQAGEKGLWGCVVEVDGKLAGRFDSRCATADDDDDAVGVAEALVEAAQGGLRLFVRSVEREKW